MSNTTVSYAGIDVGKASLHLAISQGEETFLQQTFANTPH